MHEILELLDQLDNQYHYENITKHHQNNNMKETYS